MRAALVGTIVAIGAAAAAMPATADVKAGVDAWQQGDYARAVAEWKPLAAAGDADAQFNLGQAYKLGRGVPTDLPMAMDWFRKAALQGHVRASDNYGLLLFQQGKRDEAMPYIRKSADRGEPRAQYILGTAMFNGDLVQKDWVMAYALMTRAASSGLPQASSSLTVMDKYISTEQRQKGLAIAADMDRAAAGPQYASASEAAPVQASARPAPVQQAPRRIASAPVPPSSAPPPPKTPPMHELPAYAAASDEPPPVPETVPDSAPRHASTAPPRTAAAPPPRPTPVPRATPPPRAMAMAEPPPEREPSVAPPPPERASKPPRTAATVPKPPPGGNWRVQMGAFREQPRANALWREASARIANLASYKPYLVSGGDVTRLQAGPLRSEGDATRLCGQVRAAGYPCLVKQM